MHRRLTSLLICLIATFIVATPALAHGDAADIFAEAKANLAKADFDAALKLMKEAASAAPDNQEYAQELRLLQRVIKIRTKLDMNASPKKWERTARSLRSYYYVNKVYSEALAIDKVCHEKLHTADTAARLGKTMLEMDKNAEAAEFLGSLTDDLKSERADVLCALAWAREGKTDDAGKIADGMKEEKEPSAVQAYERACLLSVLGRQEAAGKLLVQAFESTLPSRLDEFKQYVKESSDLASFFKTPIAAKVMDTKSKVPESKCSGGSGCGKCPSRSGCSKDKAKSDCDDKEKHDKEDGSKAEKKE